MTPASIVRGESLTVVDGEAYRMRRRFRDDPVVLFQWRKAESAEFFGAVICSALEARCWAT